MTRNHASNKGENNTSISGNAHAAAADVFRPNHGTETVCVPVPQALHKHLIHTVGHSTHRATWSTSVLWYFDHTTEKCL